MEVRIPVRTSLTLARERYHIRRFFASLETRAAIVDGKVYLLVYNEEAPELSYILIEPL